MLTPLTPLTPLALAGPYSGAAGTPGSDAISKDDPRIVEWASGHSEYHIGTDVDTIWQTPANAYGPATASPFDIVCLGDNGSITMYFPHPIMDGAGPDFAVFENAHSDGFLELAFIEVSSDGIHFFRFASSSLTPSKVGAFGTIDPTNLDGLAGKHRVGFGTPFDLADLPDSPDLDKQRVLFVRVIDIKGDGKTKDSDGRPIYDPHPTIGSAGFDLNGIGVIHQQAGNFNITDTSLTDDTFSLTWQSNPGSHYRIETSTSLARDSWVPLATQAGAPTRGVTGFSTPRTNDFQRFWRVVRLDD